MENGTVSFWLLTEALDLDAERTLYAQLDLTQRSAPEGSVHLHVLNPRHSDDPDLASIVPVDAVEIPLRAPEA